MPVAIDLCYPPPTSIPQMRPIHTMGQRSHRPEQPGHSTVGTGPQDRRNPTPAGHFLPETYTVANSTVCTPASV